MKSRYLITNDLLIVLFNSLIYGVLIYKIEAKAFGSIAAVLTLSTLVGGILELGIYSFINIIHKNFNFNKNTISSIIKLKIICIMISLPIYFSITYFLFDDDTKKLAIIGYLGVIAIILSSSYYLTVKNGKINIIFQIIKYIIIIFSIFFLDENEKTYTYILSIYGFNLIFELLAFIFIIKNNKISKKDILNAKILVILKGISQSIGTLILFTVSNNIVTLLIQKFINVELAGIYFIVTKILNIQLQIFSNYVKAKSFSSNINLYHAVSIIIFIIILNTIPSLIYTSFISNHNYTGWLVNDKFYSILELLILMSLVPAFQSLNYYLRYYILLDYNQSRIILLAQSFSLILFVLLFLNFYNIKNSFIYIIYITEIYFSFTLIIYTWKKSKFVS
jgi:hypothetical protein